MPELFAAQAARTPDAVALVAGAHADLSRARHPRQPAGAPSAQLGVGPETIVGPVRCAVGGPGGRGARRAQGGRGLPAARSGLPPAAAAVHARRRRRPIVVTPARCGCRLPRASRPHRLISTPTAPCDRAERPRRRRPLRPRHTPPTSSTPRARPDNQRAWPSPTAASSIAAWRATDRFGGRRRVLTARSASTPRLWEIWLPLVPAARCVIAPPETCPRILQHAGIDRREQQRHRRHSSCRRCCGQLAERRRLHSVSWRAVCGGEALPGVPRPRLRRTLPADGGQRVRPDRRRTIVRDLAHAGRPVTRQRRHRRSAVRSGTRASTCSTRLRPVPAGGGGRAVLVGGGPGAGLSGPCRA